jgi:hypothetical protein
MHNPSRATEQALVRLLSVLVDQRQARVLVSPYRDAPGFWFGGGNLVLDPGGTIWLSGRYRNFGDSRTGLQAGERGLECTILRSDDGGQSFSRVRSWSKADLSRNEEVLSIEGTALHRLPDGAWELFISSEKASPYPEALRHYQKAGTGVWSIDRIVGASVEELDAATIAPVLAGSDRPEYLHVKDPAVFDGPDEETRMVFCSHPYCWTSSNSGLARRRAGENAFRVQTWEMASRGTTWDVAVTRVTDRMPVPPVGPFAGRPACSVYFYDGAECVRSHEQSSLAYARPRGYSCEEIGGAFWGEDGAWPDVNRLSLLEPLFISPWGTGASRYVHSLVTSEWILVTWEQSQEDGSQPLVGHRVSMKEVKQILAG